MSPKGQIVPNIIDRHHGSVILQTCKTDILIYEFSKRFDLNLSWYLKLLSNYTFLRTDAILIWGNFIFQFRDLIAIKTKFIKRSF